MWSVAVLGWTPFSTPRRNLTQTYHIDASFCDGVRPRFRESVLFTWSSFGCDDVRTIVRASFDAWQHNSPLSFVESLDRSDAGILLSRAALDDGIVGLARRSVLGEEIEVDGDACWYTDRDFCHAVSRDRDVLYGVLLTAWVLSLASVLALLCRPLKPFQGVWRLLSWSVALAVPLLYFGAVRPCTSCYDFASVMMHEIGHVLGLGHSDDANQTCGCGGARRPCGARDTDPTILMHSALQRRRRTCLSRDDADGARTLYGGRCDDPVWCYESYDVSGYHRVLVALVYSLAVSLVVVGVRNAIDGKGRDGPPEQLPRPVPPRPPVRRPASSI